MQFGCCTHAFAARADGTTPSTLLPIQELQQLEGDHSSRVIRQCSHVVIGHEKRLHSGVHVHPDVGLELLGQPVQNLHLWFTARRRRLSVEDLTAC